MSSAQGAHARSRLALAALLLLAPSLWGAPPPFEERAEALGLLFEHFSGMSGELYFSEDMGAGGAFFDFDGDDDLDVFLVQGSWLGPGPLSTATFPPRHDPPFAHRLFRNDLEVGKDGGRTLRFVDVTATSGITPKGYGMGVTAGDYDNDGRIDLYVTAVGSNQLLHNEGGGVFADVTEAAGVDEERWSVSAAFFDYDSDGWLDLFVANYVDFRLATHKVCSTDTGARDYCGPEAYQPETDRLFRNRGDGTFVDVTTSAGLSRQPGAGLGAAVADFDRDGRLDLYVANDGTPNFLWLNQGDGTLVDGALLGGCAVNAEGHPEASMGVVPGDFDGDGDIDLFMTHLARQTNTLFLNDGRGLFTDTSARSGVGRASWKYTGFGTALFDYDGDGRLDLYVANGAVHLEADQLTAGSLHPIAQRNLLLRGIGPARFEDATASGGPALELVEASRGVAAGDVDNDGDVDLLVTNNAGPVRLLVNQSAESPWIGLRMVAGERELDQLGTLVELVLRDTPSIWRLARVDGSYASANDPRIVARGLDPAAVTMVRVRWPDGTTEIFDPPPAFRYSSLKRGSGRPPS